MPRPEQGRDRGCLSRGRSWYPGHRVHLCRGKVLSWIIASMLGACTAQAGIQPVLAAILAAIFSTASPIFLAVGTMFSQDICSLRERSEASLLRINRAAVAAAGIICAVGAVLLVDAGQILDMVYGAYALRGAIFIIILYGIYWKRAHQRAAVASMLLTAIAAVMWTAIELVTGSYPVAPWFSETYAAVLTAAISMPICVLLIKPEQPLGNR
ncbi:MAG: hypothetical protein LUE21_09580 [Oscillospiraceae bacterium]|nr:hypothetical protein [Oscillospiraceae bacterium]